MAAIPEEDDALARLALIQREIRGLTASPEDQHRRAVLYRDAVAQATRLQNAALRGRMQLQLGQSLLDDPLGDRPSNTEEAIHAFNAALLEFDESGLEKEWADTQIDLSVAFVTREVGDHAENLELALAAQTAAVEYYSDSQQQPQYANIQANLGSIYYDRRRGDLIANQEQAIAHFELALNGPPKSLDLLRWAAIQVNLANLFLARRLGEAADNLERALAYGQAALWVFNEKDYPNDWATTNTALGNILAERIQGNPIENADRAISYYQRAMTAHTRQAHPKQWAMLCNNLGRIFTERVGGDHAENIETAIRYCDLALTIHTMTECPYEWGMTQHNLGNAYASRSQGTRVENLEEAIACYKRALEVRTHEHYPDEWALTTHNLGSAYLERISGDRVRNIELAITYHLEVLTVYRHESYPYKWAMIQDSLGQAHAARARLVGSTNMDQAVAHYREALTVYTKENSPRQWGMTLNNLGNALLESVSAPDNVEQAISCFRDSLEVITEDFAPLTWSAIEGNLAAAYLARQIGSVDENIDTAISLHQASLRVLQKETTPLEWAKTQCNLAAAYSDGRRTGNRTQKLALAIECFSRGLSVFTDNGLWTQCVNAGRALGGLAVEAEQWERALEGYEAALHASDILYGSSITHSSKEQVLTAAFGLHSATAYALTRAGRTWDAVVTLERGRARGLDEALATRDAALKEIADTRPNEYKAYWQAAERIRDVEARQWRLSALLRGTADDLAPRGREAFEWSISQLEDSLSEMDDVVREAVNEGIAKMRRMGGAKRFLESAMYEQAEAARRELAATIADLAQIERVGRVFELPTFADISRAVEPGCPLAYITITSAGCLTLLLSRNQRPNCDWETADVTVEELPQADQCINATDLERIVRAYLDCQDRPVANLGPVLAALLSALGESYGQRLSARLLELEAEAVVIIACGPLGLLPLHSATFECAGRETSLIQDFDVTFAPSARILSALRARLSELPARFPYLAAVGNPETRLASLRFSEIEVEHAASCFEHASVYYGRDATKQAILQASAAATHVHFACHGEFDPLEPRHSYLALAQDRPYELARLGPGGLPDSYVPDAIANIAANSGVDPLTAAELLSERPFDMARLAVASACQTAVIDWQSLPDEVVGFPAALLQAGALGVIGTLWKVNDLSTALLMGRFYSDHLGRGASQPTHPAHALRLAQCWLANVSASELAEHFAAIRMGSLLGDRGVSDELASFWMNRFGDMNPDSKPFSNPFFWAPFVYVGV
jgi:CHAT domain-containing protein